MKLGLISLAAAMLMAAPAFADDGVATVAAPINSVPAPVTDLGADPSPAPLPPSEVEAPAPVVTSVTTTTTSVPVVQPTLAPTQEYRPDVTQSYDHPVPFKLGMSFDLSVPSGVALGLEARLPHVPWFKLGLSGTATLAPGIRGNILIDPIKFPVTPVANIDLGRQFGFKVPGLANSPTIDYTYVDLQGGLAFGSRDGFRFLLLAGMSHLNGTAHNFQQVIGTSVDGLTVADPSFHGWIPDAKLGCEFLF